MKGSVRDRWCAFRGGSSSVRVGGRSTDPTNELIWEMQVRNISFMLTVNSFKDGSKDVTRRNGWLFLESGDRLMAVEKGQGLRKGEKIKRLGEIEVLSVTREPLYAIFNYPNDCAREGFPHLLPQEFIEFYCKHNGGTPDQMVTRIAFRKIE